MRESTIENHLKLVAAACGMRAYKWVSPGLRGVPDQIVLASIPHEHQALVARYIRLIELKAPGKEARGQQVLRHTELRALGFTVHDSVDSKQLAAQIIGSMG